MDKPVNHVRIIDVHSGKRINDAPGFSHTLCGGDMTDRDVGMQNAKKMYLGRTLDKWLKCPKCTDLIRRLTDVIS